MERAVRSARAAPRGYAKSTLEALVKPIHDICYGLESFVVIVSNTQSQSDQKLRDIRTEVLTNYALISAYGLHFKVKKPGETRFTVHSNAAQVLFLSIGAGTEVRGIRTGANRPSKIIADDMEHSEEVLNEAIRKKYEDWFFQVISKIGNKNTNINVVGTILHPQSLLAGLTKNAAYDSRIYKAVKSWSTNEKLWQQWTRIYTNLDNDNRKQDAQTFYQQNEIALLAGTDVLWKEHESYLDLMKEMIETGRRAFMKEKQNEPQGNDNPLFDDIWWYRETEKGFYIEKTGSTIPFDRLKDAEGRWLNSYGVIDPAAGQTKIKAGKLGDFACALVGMKDERKRLFVHHDWTKRAQPTWQIRKIYELHEEFQFQKFGVETNLFRNLLMQNLVAERERMQRKLRKMIHLGFYDIENTQKKEERIYTLEPKVTHGWILFNRALSQEFVSQLTSFPNPDMHDDCPDALEMLWGLVNNRFKASEISKNPMGGR